MIRLEQCIDFVENAIRCYAKLWIQSPALQHQFVNGWWTADRYIKFDEFLMVFEHIHLRYAVPWKISEAENLFEINEDE